MIKKLLSTAFIALFVLGLVSWGYVGHKVTGKIAEAYLTPKAKSATKTILGTESIGDVASWADEVRSTQEYKYTAPWHFLNLELGLNYEQFVKTIKALPGENVYTAILKCEAELRSKTTTIDQKAIALKFLIHFIGDAHQPMHISRAEDKGGNTIQVQFFGRGTNLHSVWDSGIIGKEGLSDSQLAEKLEAEIKPNDIKDYQQSDLMKWLFESYTISSRLYKEVEKNNILNEVYYKEHVDLLNERLAAGGIRLAGVLNAIFENSNIVSVAKTTVAQSKVSVTNLIEAKDAANYIGQTVTVQAKVYSSKDLGSMVLVNLGAAYPNQPLTVVFRGDAKFLASDIDNKTIAVTGAVIEYKGKPEIVVTNTNQVKF